MAVIERKYDCPRCWGTGSLESSDSTDESWWDCSTCKGTGKLADRRRPDPQLRGAVEERDRLKEENRQLRVRLKALQILDQADVVE